MGDTFELAGSFSTRPLLGNPSGIPAVYAPIDEKVQLENKSVQFFDLTSDSVVNVLFPSGMNCNVLVVKVDGGKARVRITSSDGATQAVPVDPIFVLISRSVAITAIDVMRVAGTQVQVTVFFGDLAA